jgi:hypothetical protein
VLIGARAVAAYAPERHTKDVAFMVRHEDFVEAERRLRATGWQRRRMLVFPNAALGFHGSAWSAAGGEADLLASPQAWAREAFAATPVFDQNGERVMPLPFLVLMKLDSARASDQADLQRMLGLVDAALLDSIVATVQHYGDPAAADDVRQYHELGRWEYETTSDG